jgi:hypothetical protein
MIDILKEQQKLRNRLPLAGTFIRRGAARRLAAELTPDAVHLLVEALADSDEQVRQTAESALQGSDREALAALSRLAIDDPAGPAAQFCLKHKLRPPDPESKCLFLFVTRQLEEYFQEDFEFQNLRAAYDRASQKVKDSVMEIVRGGDRRCLGFFGRRKPLRECDEREIRLAVDSGLRHKDWPRLFSAFLEMPLKYGFPLLAEFRRSGWEPDKPEMKSLYKQAMEEAKDGVELPRKRTDATSSVFERWLSGDGRPTGSEAELAATLKDATPPDGVRIVGALAALPSRTPQTVDAVKTSPHWLVRLAGYATGMVQLKFGESSKDDANYWVRELTNAEGALEFWPVNATPADQDALNALPREAFTGKLGAVRRVLQLLIGHRMTSGTWEEVIYDAGEFAGEFEEA